jgi:hypothetical protein
MAVGLTNEDARNVPRVIFYGHFSATPDIARKGLQPSVCDHDFAGRDLDEPVRRASDHPIVKRRVAHEADDEQIIAATLDELSYCRNRVSHDHMCFQGDALRFRLYVRVYRDGVEEAGSIGSCLFNLFNTGRMTRKLFPRKSSRVRRPGA